MAIVGASSDSLSQVVSASTSTAALSAETGTLTAAQGQKVITEIDEAAAAFSREFGDIGTKMLDQVRATNNDVQALAAVGMSADQAKTAADDFARQLGELQTTTETAIAEFRTSATNRANAINEVIGPKLGAILTGFNTDVTAFGTAVSGFATGLSDIDSTAIQYR